MTQRLLRNAMKWVPDEDGKGTVTISKVATSISSGKGATVDQLARK
jgi:hypothetical protein